MKVKLTGSEKEAAVLQNIDKVPKLNIPVIDERKDQNGVFVNHGISKTLLDVFVVRHNNLSYILIATLKEDDPFDYEFYLLPQDYMDWVEFVMECQNDTDSSFLPIVVEFSQRVFDGKYVVDVKRGE